MAKIDNIKTLWGMMLTDTKQEAVRALMENYGLTSETALKQNWIYRGMIPEDYQDGVIEIFQKLLRKQHKATSELI